MGDEKQPNNDVIDHFNRIEGNATDPANTKLKNSPKPIKYFGYFAISFFVITFLVIFILNIMK
ncbi:hypothetical protein ACQYAD_12280 [Neobacillus sp. SM06]|uniref:hypothetical protein n=1 Tax=Neobacillus sp. SM06 TaxID=3422492 RepID=UPI003D2BD678